MMQFDWIHNLFLTVVSVCGVFLLYKVLYLIIAFFPKQKLKETDKQGRFAVLIPARNESKVIRGILDSLAGQDYDMSLVDVYVIIENTLDPTAKICEEYGANVFVRRHLERKGKGHALSEVIDEIKNAGKEYDAYFIFDADNVIEKDFLVQMNKAYQSGYDIALGYRRSKNANDSYVAACSGLTFSFVNTAGNKARSYLGQNVTLSGTGFYLSAKILREAGGWQFFNLTEDYELSVHAAIKNYKTRYVEQAVFYDEQPKTLKTSDKQRIRWIKGYQNVRKQYSRSLVKSMLSGNNFLSKLEFSMGLFPSSF